MQKNELLMAWTDNVTPWVEENKGVVACIHAMQCSMNMGMCACMRLHEHVLVHLCSCECVNACLYVHMHVNVFVHECACVLACACA